MILELLNTNPWRFAWWAWWLAAGVVARERDVQIQPAYGVIAP